MADLLWWMDRVFLWATWKNVHHKISIEFIFGSSQAMLLILLTFLWKKKSFNLLCSVARCLIILKNDSIITKSIIYRWKEKIIRDFNVLLCIICWDNYSPLGPSFKWHATSSHEWLRKFTCFLQLIIFICFIWTALDKSASIITLFNTDSWFITEYHFRPIVHTP